MIYGKRSQIRSNDFAVLKRNINDISFFLGVCRRKQRCCVIISFSVLKVTNKILVCGDTNGLCYLIGIHRYLPRISPRDIHVASKCTPLLVLSALE